jgi:hypothetical protein
MAIDIAAEVAALQQMQVGPLRSRYAEVFGEVTLARHKVWLIKRIAWRLQALAEGDLSERARRRAAELANDADLRWSPPKAPSLVPDQPATASPTKPTAATKKPVLVPGTLLSRPYKGRTLQVKVLAQGFLYGEAIYPSLSAVAKAITGSHCNGIAFFRLRRPGGAR